MKIPVVSGFLPFFFFYIVERGGFEQVDGIWLLL